MESATKALIMAAGILIGIVILSLAVYLFSYLGSYAKDVENINRRNQISQFNSQFLSYKEKKKPIYDNTGENVIGFSGGLTIYDVISLANLAHDYNENNGLTDKSQEEYITVNIENGGGVSQKPDFEKSVKDFKISENQSYVYKTGTYDLRSYNCYRIDINDLTQKVKTIHIKPE